ncbi:MAG: carboxypeptidase-like regulatory domain-containing protein, partial [Treponema sp.]|nr:carboxypeptidase-like regulatory domain-containing protein [Treponema sp.]
MKSPRKLFGALGFLLILLALASCGQKSLPEGWGWVDVHLLGYAQSSLGLTQAVQYTDYFEMFFHEVGSDSYYLASGQTGDTISLQVPGEKYYEILILSGYDYDQRFILQGSIFANHLVDDTAIYDPSGMGVPIEANQRLSLSFELDRLSLDPITDYTLAFSTGGVPTQEWKPDRLNGRLAYSTDAVSPLSAQSGSAEFSVTVALSPGVKSLIRAGGVRGITLDGLDGRLSAYHSAGRSFDPLTGSMAGVYTTSGDLVSLGFTLGVAKLQEVDPVDGDWKFDFEGYYYGFGTPDSGGKRWTIRNGLMNALDRLGSIGGALWVRFGQGNGFSDGELSDISGRITLAGGGAGSGATVRLVKLEQQGSAVVASEVLTVQSGENGVYRIEGVLPGTYQVEAELSGYVTGEGEIFGAEGGTLGDKDVELRRPWIRGTISKNDEGGGALSGATVRLLDTGGTAVDPPVTAPTGSDGRYTLKDVFPGAYTIEVSADAYAPGRITGVQVDSADRTGQDLTLERVYTISGTISKSDG